MNARIAIGIWGVLTFFVVFAACGGNAPQAASGGNSGGAAGSAGGGNSGGAAGNAGAGNSGGAGGIAGGGNSGGAAGNAGGGAGGWVGDGGVPDACVNVGGDYGDCATVLGWGFDGTACKIFSGCDCEPNCGSFFPSATSCATTCAAAGNCDTAAMKPLYLAKDPVEEGDHCDGVYICTPEASASYINDLFPNIVCEMKACEGAGQSCSAYYNGTLTAEKWENLCAASLLPGIEDIFCVIYGP